MNEPNLKQPSPRNIGQVKEEQTSDCCFSRENAQHRLRRLIETKRAQLAGLEALANALPNVLNHDADGALWEMIELQ